MSFHNGINDAEVEYDYDNVWIMIKIFIYFVYFFSVSSSSFFLSSCFATIHGYVMLFPLNLYGAFQVMDLEREMVLTCCLEMDCIKVKGRRNKT